MVPRTILRQLARLRWRERWLQLTWLAARWLPLLAAALLGACLIDWSIDRRRETPFALRAGLLVAQAVLWSVALLVLARVGLRRRSNTSVALWVEDRVPQFGHRLISAVQLNQPGAATQGMSPELIAAVTRQAEEQAAKMNFADLADSRRLKWSAGLIAPLLLGVVVLLILCPATVLALVARQFLADRDIPRSVQVVRTAPEVVWPSGEEVSLRFRVRGPVSDAVKGEVRVDPDNGQPSEQYQLVFESKDATGDATFVARVPPATVDFACFAWVEDGRSREPAHVHFEPRPVVQKQEAWVQLPRSVGLRSDSQPFEEPQKGADLVHRLPGSSARLAIEVQKPIAQATVEVLGLPHPFVARTDSQSEAVRRSVNLTVQDDGQHARGTFLLANPVRPEFLAALATAPGAGIGGVAWAPLVLSADNDQMPPEMAYRIVVRDRYGFENLDRPRRSIRAGTVDPPEVVLLPEYFARTSEQDSAEEREVEGIPVLLGGRLKLEYQCSAEYGLSHAQLRYRVIKKGATSEDDADPSRDHEFLPLPLGAPRGTAESNISEQAWKEFYTLPSSDPNKLGGRSGGGRYDFDSAGIPDGKGGLLELKVGDRIQFYVEVFGKADPDGVPGRSTIREKEVVALPEFLAWIEKKDDQKERIRQLEAKQRGKDGRMAPEK